MGAQRDAAGPAAVSREELCSAIEWLRQLIPVDELSAFDLGVSPATVYTNLVTLWLLTLQRLGGGSTLAQAVKDLKERHADLLPDNRRVRDGTLSDNTAAYSRARSRLPLATARQFAERVAQSLIEWSPPDLGERRVFVIDGTTLTLAPTSELKKLYPPATNQFGESVWPVLLLLVAHELRSGVALVPELGAMYGDDNTSEAKLTTAIAAKIPKDSIVMADAGFGIFGVAWSVRQAGHDVLFRLTKSRFQSLVRNVQPLTPQFTTDASGTIRKGDNATWRMTWRPSAKDRKTHPHLPPDAFLDVFVHAVRLPNGEWLYLVTTLDISAVDAAERYERRYDVEFDIRDVKVTLDLESIRAKTDAMMQKELLCGIVAYNLVQQLRRLAATKAGVQPRRLSFTNVWTTMQIYLLQKPPCSLPEWQARFDRALASASKAKLPNRPNRSAPRKALPRRPKATHEQRHKKIPPASTPPPKKTK